MSEDAHGGQKRVAELLDLQLQEVVLSLLLLVQVTDPGFSARAAISLTPLSLSSPWDWNFKGRSPAFTLSLESHASKGTNVVCL